MKAIAVSVLDLFAAKMQLEVPLFQRQYVWGQTEHWEPLWEDIARKFTDYLDGRKDAPVHFLGAMVLDLKQTPATHVGKRQVIDGQQRLTTLQIFLAAFRDFCFANGWEELGKECRTYTFNSGMMATPDVDKFKVWPTQLDRAQFADVLSAGSREELMNRHPLRRRPYARKYDPRPRMVEAYFFFSDQLRAFFLGADGVPVIATDVPLDGRLMECFQALRERLQIVEIDLEDGDDAQVIFETLNARGAPLLPADLLRNFVFLRAARRGEPQEELYKLHWSRFDDPFWRTEVKQGRLNRPRSDLFLQHFLASRLAVDIPVKTLFVEYKHWIDKGQPFGTVRAEVECLARQGDDFRRIISPPKPDALYGLSTFLEAFDVRTCYPLLLAMLDAGVSDDGMLKVAQVLESYLLRRAICDLTTQNYNRVFLSLTRSLRKEGFSAKTLATQLAAHAGASSEWPSDAAVTVAWREAHAYRLMQNPKLVCMLKRVSDTFTSSKSEQLVIEGALTVEHLMPQKWVEHWPLGDGTPGLTLEERRSAAPDDLRAQACARRDHLVQSFGNLTLVTQPLNSAASNGPWADKQRELRHSVLPLNRMLHDFATWDEVAIMKRSDVLLNKVLSIWPRP